MQPIVEDPVDDDRIPAQTRMIPALCEPSEFEKMKHELTHIPFQPWCTSCVTRKAQAEPRKRIERIVEDCELPLFRGTTLFLNSLQLPMD